MLDSNFSRDKDTHGYRGIKALLGGLLSISRARFSSALKLLSGAIKNRAAPAETDPIEIRIGLTTRGRDGRQFAAATTLAFAHVHGGVDEIFKGTRTQIKWLFFKGAGPAISKALADGQLDFAVQGDLPSVIARSKGVRTRLLLTAQLRRLSLAVPADSGIQTLADLRGQKVANNAGTALQLAMIRILSAAGLTEQDVKMVDMDMTTAIAALASHQIDAAVVGVGAEELEESGQVKLAYAQDLDNAKFASVSGFFVTDDFVKRYPQTVNKVVQAVVNAAHWGSDPQNREAAFATWAQSGHPASAFRNIYGDKPLARYLSPLLDDFALARFETAASDALRCGLIDQPVQLTDWVDTKPLETALKTLKLETYWTPYDKDGNPTL